MRALGAEPLVRPQAGPLFDPDPADLETDGGGAPPETSPPDPGTRQSRPPAGVSRLAPEPVVPSARPSSSPPAVPPAAPAAEHETDPAPATADKRVPPALPTEARRMAEPMPLREPDAQGERAAPPPLLAAVPDRERHVATEVGPPATPISPVAASVAAKPASAPREDRVDRPEPLAGPTIRVTIGRVELRAVIEPPKAPRADRRKSALMSLDDYLKQGRS